MIRPNSAFIIGCYEAWGCKNVCGCWSGIDGRVGLQVGKREGTARRAELKVVSSGLSAGADMHVTDGLTLGIGGGYGWDRSKLEDSRGRVVARNALGAFYFSAVPVDGGFSAFSGV